MCDKYKQNLALVFIYNPVTLYLTFTYILHAIFVLIHCYLCTRYTKALQGKNVIRYIHLEICKNICLAIIYLLTNYFFIYFTIYNLHFLVCPLIRAISACSITYPATHVQCIQVKNWDNKIKVM